MKSLTTVNVRLQPSTIRKIGKLKRMASLNTRADAVRLGAEVGVLAARVLADGGSIKIENPDGTIERLVIPGILTED